MVQLVLQEATILSLLGTLFGLSISRIILFLLPLSIKHQHSFSFIQLDLLVEELWLFPIALLVGIIASLIPIIISYNINIPKTLYDD